MCTSVGRRSRTIPAELPGLKERGEGRGAAEGLGAAGPRSRGAVWGSGPLPSASPAGAGEGLWGGPHPTAAAGRSYLGSFHV